MYGTSESLHVSEPVARWSRPAFFQAALARFPRRKKWLLLRTGLRAFFLPHRVMSMPVFMQVEPTTRCNLSCAHCPRVLLDLPGKDMAVDGFRHVIDETPELLFLHLQGLGEPFLHPELFDMIDYAAKRGILVGTCTNGHESSPQLLQSLAASRLSYLAVSIDGTGGVLEQLRKGSDYELLVRNLKDFAQAKRPETMLAFWVVIQERNLSELDDIVALAEANGVGHILFTFMHAAFAPEPTGGSLLRTQGEVALRTLRKRMARRCKQSGIQSSFSGTVLHQRLTHCRWPWYACSIGVDGNATPCCLIHEDVVLGNVFEASLARIWQGDAYQAFRHDLTRAAIPAPCRNCQYL